MKEQTMAPAARELTHGDLAEALFCSSLQPSDVGAEAVDSARVLAAIDASLRNHHGQIRECAEELAASYGKDPEITCLRMRWARSVIARTFPPARVAS